MENHLQSSILGGDTRVNAVGVDELFQLYSRTGFLYPAKMRKLAPFLPLIRENWRKALQAQERILMLFTNHDEQGGIASSIGTWRSTHRGWLSQHLVSASPNPMSTGTVLLYAQRTKMQRGDDDSHQNWYRPENRYPARVFGSVLTSLGRERAALHAYSMFHFSRGTAIAQSRASYRVAKFDASHTDPLHWLARETEGPVFVRAEELTSDPELKVAAEIYSTVGLHRSRSIWLAYDRIRDEPVAAVLAYRGPLGMNFSFLENRCHLVLHPSLTDDAATGVVLPLLECARSAYRDFELDTIPVIAPAQHAPALTRAGLEFVRNYNQSIWVREGFEDWYAHVDRFYTRLISRQERHLSAQSNLQAERIV